MSWFVKPWASWVNCRSCRTRRNWGGMLERKNRCQDKENWNGSSETNPGSLRAPSPHCLHTAEAAPQAAGHPQPSQPVRRFKHTQPVGEPGWRVGPQMEQISPTSTGSCGGKSPLSWIVLNQPDSPHHCQTLIIAFMLIKWSYGWWEVLKPHTASQRSGGDYLITTVSQCYFLLTWFHNSRYK